MSTGSSAVEYFKALLEATRKEEEKQEEDYHQLGGLGLANPQESGLGLANPTGEYGKAAPESPVFPAGSSGPRDDLLGIGIGAGEGTTYYGGKNVSLPALWDLRDSWDSILSGDNKNPSSPLGVGAEESGHSTRWNAR